MLCSEDVDYAAFGRDLASFFSELETLNSSLVISADGAAGGRAGMHACQWGLQRRLGQGAWQRLATAFNVCSAAC